MGATRRGAERSGSSESRLLTHYQMAGSLDQPREWREVVQTAADEHAKRVAYEG